MRREEYLYTLTEQIRCKMARGTIEQEINDHIEDQKAEFLSEGMSQTEAEEAAVREMGDPVEVGLEMDRIHPADNGVGNDCADCWVKSCRLSFTECYVSDCFRY